MSLPIHILSLSTLPDIIFRYPGKYFLRYQKLLRNLNILH